jgi:uncharacterized Zn-finger protein
MANLEINLDLLIQDCLKAYTEETLEFEILPPARSTTGHYEEFPGQLILPEHILSFNSAEEIAPVTPAEVSELPLNNRFICSVCSKPYRGKRELTRHMKKHSSPNKYSCTVEGCLQTMYRIDAMSCHVKIHEQRIKTQMERKNGQPKVKKVTQKKD